MDTTVMRTDIPHAPQHDPAALPITQPDAPEESPTGRATPLDTVYTLMPSLSALALTFLAGDHLNTLLVGGTRIHSS